MAAAANAATLADEPGVISPDGRRAVCAWTDRLSLAERAGPSRPIGPKGVPCRAARWSPDGRRLAFIVDRDSGPELWLRENGAERRLEAPHPADGAPAPVWSHDGRRVFFVAQAGASEAVIAVSLSSGAETLAFTDCPPCALELSASGRTLAVWSQPRIDAPLGERVATLELVSTKDGEVAHRAERVSAEGDLAFRWSHRDDRLAYVQDGRLWLLDLRAAPPSRRQLGAELTEIEPRPLLFRRAADALLVEARGGLHLVPLNGDQSRPVKGVEKAESFLSADGRSLWEPEPNTFTFLSQEGRDTVARRVSFKRGTIRRLWRGRGRLNGWSAAGRDDGIAGVRETAKGESLEWFDPDFRPKHRFCP